MVYTHVASEDTSQVISHCYTSLQNYMDADSVSHMMLCENLITDDDYEAITAAPNDYKMNTLLVQYVRSMNAKQLSKFCDILKTVDSHKIIKDCSSCKYLVYVFIKLLIINVISQGLFMHAYVTIWFCHYHLLNALTHTFFLNQACVG